MMPLVERAEPESALTASGELIAAPASVGVIVSMSSRATATICPESFVGKEIGASAFAAFVNTILP
jgi:hypothetical protein